MNFVSTHCCCCTYTSVKTVSCCWLPITGQESHAAVCQDLYSVQFFERMLKSSIPHLNFEGLLPGYIPQKTAANPILPGSVFVLFPLALFCVCAWIYVVQLRAVPEIILREVGWTALFFRPLHPEDKHGVRALRPPGHASALVNPPHYGSNMPWPPGQVTPHPSDMLSTKHPPPQDK